MRQPTPAGQGGFNSASRLETLLDELGTVEAHTALVLADIRALLPEWTAADEVDFDEDLAALLEGLNTIGHRANANKLRAEQLLVRVRR